MRKVLVVLFGLIASSSFFFNYMLLTASILAILGASLMKVNKRVASVFVVFIALLVIFVWTTAGFLPKRDLQTYSKLPEWAQLAAGTDSIPLQVGLSSPDDSLARITEFRLIAFERARVYRGLSNVIEEVENARRLRDAILKSKSQVQDLSSLTGWIEGLNQVVTEQFKNIDSAESAVNAASGFIVESVEAFDKSPLVEMDRRKKDFLLRLNQFHLEGMVDRAKGLQTEVTRLVDQVLANQIKSSYSANSELDEINQQWVTIETYEFEFSAPGIFRNLDVRELLLENQLGNLSRTITCHDGDGRELLLRNAVAQIPINSTRLRVDCQTRIIADLQSMSSPYVPIPMLRTTFNWRGLFPTTIWFSAELSNFGVETNCSYGLEIAKIENLESIRLPLNSVYACAATVEIDRSGGLDCLKLNEGPAASYLKEHQSFWIEMLPDNICFRNFIMQKGKSFLVSENALAALVFAIYSAMLVAVFKIKD
jgi:hypothetical protein